MVNCQLIQQHSNHRILTVLVKQCKECVAQPINGIRLIMNESQLTDIQADIMGPEKTPYEGGTFRCRLSIDNTFPQSPPKCYFTTKIFHPNISYQGEVCVSTLKKDWNPLIWSLQHIFEIIKCLLIIPFPESALNEEAGKLFMQDYDEYCTRAKLITELYGTPKELKNLGDSYTQYLINDEDKGDPKFNKQYMKMKKWLKRI